ncbi:MAG: glycosyltransferase family 39 protein [Alphaproteobacteria bacterium]
MNKNLPHFLAWTLLWGGTVATGLIMRPLMPLDETRYLAVAWEMWRSGNLLVPELNGTFYSHKPPLLFWLINAGWYVFGPVEVWARLVAPTFGLASVFMTFRLARLLWPGSRTAQLSAPWILSGTLLWLGTTTLSMFDTMVMFCVLTALVGIAVAATARADGGALKRGKFVQGWILFALGVGLGVLAKGPVVLVFTLPAALLAPVWWAPAEARVRVGVRNWYPLLLVAVIAGAGIALAWAIPAALSGGEAFARAIFLGQTTERIAGSFSHGRPFWWYAPALLALLFPWVLWPTLWRGLWAADWRRDPGVRFAGVWLVAAFVVLSLFTDKQPHYFLPAVPAFALLAARALTTISAFEAPKWTLAIPLIFLVLVGGAMVVVGIRPDLAIALASDAPIRVGQESVIAGALLLIVVVLGFGGVGRDVNRQVQTLAVQAAVAVVAVHIFAGPALVHLYDLREPAQRIRTVFDAGKPVAHIGKYHGQFQYLGRLEKPLDVIDGNEVVAWFDAHPDGVAVYLHRRRDDIDEGTALYVQPFRGRWLALWERAGASRSPEIFTR